MQTDALAAQMVRKLTKAQREAIISAPSTPYGNRWLVCAGSTKMSLVRRGIAEGYGTWCTLTDLGKSVRRLLESAHD